MVALSKITKRSATAQAECGSSLIQSTIVLFLMFVVFFGVINIGLTYYSMTTVQTQIQGAVSRADVTKVISGSDTQQERDEAFKQEIVKNSGAIVEDNLIVQNTTVTPTEYSPIIEVNKVRDTGSGTWADEDAKILYVREDAFVETEILYHVPMIANVPMMGRAILHQWYRGTQCVKTRIEIFR